MADRVINEQIVKEDPQVAAYRLALLKSSQQLTKNPMTLPAYQVAGMSPFENQAMRLAQKGLGSYMPYMRAGTNALDGAGRAFGNISPIAKSMYNMGQGVEENMQGYVDGISNAGDQAWGRVSGLTNQMESYGMGAAQSARGMYDTDITQEFMNPYQEAVTDQAIKDIQRQSAIDMQGIRAQNVAAGAFGGSRGAIAEQEFQRNVNDTMARTFVQDRSNNYLQAQQAGMAAFEGARGRDLQAGQLGLGSLQAAAGTRLDATQMQMAGQQAAGAMALDATKTGIGALQGAGQMYGSLGESYGQLGTQYGNMGAMKSQLGQEQSRFLAMLGGVQRQQAQAALDANRQTQLMRSYEPYQRLSFLSDIYSKTPSSQSTISQTTNPSASPWSQALGSGIQAYALYQGLNNVYKAPGT